MFVYGGCQGNENNFKTKVGCEKVCLNKQVVPKIPSTPKPEVPEIPDEIKGKESNVTEAPEIIPPTGTLFSGSGKISVGPLW